MWLTGSCSLVVHRQSLYSIALIFSPFFSLSSPIVLPLAPFPSFQSETLQINPLHTLIPSTMCVSFGVMLPVGNPPNAIVFSYGHVKISDMVRHARTHTHTHTKSHALCAPAASKTRGYSVSKSYYITRGFILFLNSWQTEKAKHFPLGFY